MAVPISATNTRRSLSQHYAPERGFGSASSNRKMSDSFFTSLFSTRRPHKKSNAISETTRYSSNYDLAGGKSFGESPKAQQKMVVDSGAAATKPPAISNRRSALIHHVQISDDKSLPLMDENIAGKMNSEPRNATAPSMHTSMNHFGSRRMNGSTDDTMKRISTSTPLSPVLNVRSGILAETRNVSYEGAQDPIMQWNEQQKIPRKKQEQQKEEKEKREGRSTISSFIRRSLSRSRSKQRSPSSGIADSANAKANQQRSISGEMNAFLQQPQPQLTFAQRIRLHKGIRTGNIPIELLSQKILLQKEKQEKRQEKAAAKIKEDFAKKHGASKAYSSDAINEVDPTSYLTEALFALADSQPIVARSTPRRDLTRPDATYGAKGAMNSADFQRNKQRIEERLKRNCIYEPNFYEKMLSDSLQVCEQLQTHLTGCIDGVRARSPTALSSPFTSPPTTPILTRSQSAQAPTNAFGISTSLSPQPAPLGRVSSQTPARHILTPLASPARSVLRDASNEPLAIKTKKYSYYTGPGERTSSSPLNCTPQQKYTYYTGLNQANISPTPRVRISVSGGGAAARFPNFQRQNSNGENSTNYSSSNHSISLAQMNGMSPQSAFGSYTHSVPHLIGAAACLPPIPTPPSSHRKKFSTNVHFAA